MTGDLVALAGRVERASGADRELDAEIALATAYAGCRRRTAESNHRLPVENQFGHGFFPPSYTTSLDAAMSLVPEGWAIDKLSMWPASPESASNLSAPQSHCHMVGTSVQRMGRKMVWGHGGSDGRVDATAATPALALVAAALRARAQESGHG